MLDDVAERARRTYDAAADHYDGAPLGFWERIGRRTVERLRLAHGARVLDVPCGSGSSALAAAGRVGPGGHVLAVDLAERLLGLGRAKARAAGIDNVEFRAGDMRALEAADASFDAVVCVFGIFFVPDMVEQARRFVRLLKPGGALAVTTWGDAMFAPGDAAFWAAVGEVRPDLVRGFNPWDALVTPPALRAVLADAGAADVDVVAEDGVQPLRGPDDFWSVVLGSGYRGTVDQLDDAQRERVRAATLAALAGVTAIRTPALYGTATRPAAC
jgi:ubiquinone/menaquinone biosynthesis C-methylase UbiE